MRDDPVYGELIGRLIEKTPQLLREVAAERVAGAALLTRLDQLSPAQQLVFVGNRRRYGRTVVEGILLRARTAIHRDPQEGLRLSRLAAMALSRAAQICHGCGDLKLSVLLEEANALRVVGDLAGAEKVWLEIDRLDELALDPLEEARRLSLRASFEDWRREHGRAVELLRRAVALFSDQGDRLSLCRTLIQLTGVLLRLGRADESLRVAHEVCKSLLPSDPDSLRLYAVHNLAAAADELGEFELVETFLVAAAKLYGSVGGEVDRLRRDWLLARARLGNHQRSVARTMLRHAERGFAEHGMLLEVGLVGLDLLRIDAEEERWTHLQLRAGRLVHTFSRLGVGAEARAALIVLRQSELRTVEAVHVIAGLVESVRGAAARRPAPGS